MVKLCQAGRIDENMTKNTPDKEPTKLGREVEEARRGWRILREQFKKLRNS